MHMGPEFWCLLAATWYFLDQGSWVPQLKGPLQERIIPQDKALYCWAQGAWQQWDGFMWHNIEAGRPWRKTKMEQAFSGKLAALAAKCFNFLF